MAGRDPWRKDRQLMHEKNDALEGKTDAVEMRAAEIAKREGRHDITDEDRKLAFEELKETAAPSPRPTP